MTKNVFGILTSFCISALLLASCGTSKNLSALQMQTANEHYAAGRYAEAFAAYQAIDSTIVLADSAARRNIIISAYNINNYKYIVEHAKAPIATDTTLLFALEKSYSALNIDNKSNELIYNNIDIFKNKYSEDALNDRLAAYFNTKNDKRLTEFYTKIKSDSLRVASFDNYLKFSSSTLTDEQKLELSKEILKIEPKQETALRNVAVNQYKTAEAKYNEAMTEYNKKKNATTYAYLRRDLKRISATYRECKAKFDTLHTIAPENKDYIKYLININLRLDNSAEAKALEKLL